MYGLLLLVLGLGSLGSGAVALWQRAEEARGEAESKRQDAVEAREATEAARKEAERKRQDAVKAQQEAEKARGQVVQEKEKTEAALKRERAALYDVVQEKERTEYALRREQDALQRLAKASYFHRVEIAHRDWRDNDMARADQLLEECPKKLRGWEWFYVKRLCHTYLLNFKGHTSYVTSVCFSPDGKRLASASGDKTVKVWNAQTGQEALTLKGHTGPVYSVCFSPDGKRLISTDAQGTRIVWDAASGKPLLGATDQAHPSGPRSPDGQRFALIQGNTIRLFRQWPPTAEERAEQRRWGEPDFAWHAAEARASANAGQWFAAAFHLPPWPLAAVASLGCRPAHTPSVCAGSSGSANAGRHSVRAGPLAESLDALLAARPGSGQPRRQGRPRRRHYRAALPAGKPSRRPGAAPTPAGPAAAGGSSNPHGRALR